MNQVHCFGLKPGAQGEYLMCTVLVKITEHGGDCCRSDVCGLVVSAAGSNHNHKGPSSVLGRTEHHSVNSSEIVKFLLKTNDGRGGRPGSAILSANYASAKTQECKGSISSHCFYGQLLLTRF